MHSIDCLIIAPGNAKAVYQDLAEQYSAKEPPIWAAMLAQSIRKSRTVHLIDMDGEGLTTEHLLDIVEDYVPKLIVIVVYGQQPSASTQNMQSAGEIARALKGHYPEIPILMVGGHVSALPEYTLKTEDVDYVAKGEGLNTILGLLNGDKNEDIPGLYWLEDTKLKLHVRHGPKDKNAGFLAETYPGLAWDLLPMQNYRAHSWHAFGRLHERNSYASIYTSLGCPFKCTFCCINAPFDTNSFRYWEPDFTISQLDILAKEYNVKNLKIADEMFVLNENHFMRLCEKIIERKYNFNIWAYARVDTVKPKYLETLKKAGINWLALGIESGSKHVRDGVIKGRFQQEDIVAIVKTIKDHGINIIGNYIFGLPDDTYDTMEETYRLSVDLNCEMANFYSAMAYPGSKLYDIVLSNKWELPESWLGYSQHSFETKPLRTETLTSSEVLTFRDEAFHRYFREPTYLNMIKEKFGKDTYYHVKDMTEIRLNRRWAMNPQADKAQSSSLHAQI